MWRISPISIDWVVKGFHLHIGGVELAMRPDHRGGVIFKPVFSSTPDHAVAVATRAAGGLLEDPLFRQRALERVEKAMEYLIRRVDGDLRPLALGRAGELNFLRVALDRLES